VGAPAPVPKVSVGGVGLVIGGLFFALVSGWIVITRPATVADHVRRGWTLLPVAVAARDLSPSTVITRTDVELRPFPDQLPARPFREVEPLIGKRVYLQLSRGTPITAASIGSGCPP